MPKFLTWQKRLFPKEYVFFFHEIRMVLHFLPTFLSIIHFSMISTFIGNRYINCLRGIYAFPFRLVDVSANVKN